MSRRASGGDGNLAIWSTEARRLDSWQAKNEKIQLMRQAYKVEEGNAGDLIVRGAAKDPPVRNNLAGVPVDGAVCDDCRHHHCQVCESHSAARQYSDFWICHRCGELNRRVQNSDLKGVRHELGKD